MIRFLEILAAGGFLSTFGVLGVWYLLGEDA